MVQVKMLVAAIALLMGVAVLTKANLANKAGPQQVTPAVISKQEQIVLLATGDVVIGRSVNYQLVKYTNPVWPFEQVKAVLAAGDLTVANVEAPLLQDCPTTVEGMVFCGRETAVKGLTAAGIDVATLANNHISDYGVAGIEHTVKLLHDNAIAVAGLEGPILYKEVKGLKFALLAFNDISGSVPPVLRATKENIDRLVSEARRNADVVVVAMHWGAEYSATPDSRQVELAHMVADAGADLILGNHPHWIQSAEQYKATYIKYAHGNLVFDQMWSEQTKKGVIGRYTFEGTKLVAQEFIPTYIIDYGQPQL
jgi:poly-gamma-glutamate synthesis protein (capsule biosynthesis protein)